VQSLGVVVEAEVEVRNLSPQVEAIGDAVGYIEEERG